MLGEHGRGWGFESRHPRHPSSTFYKLALSESGCISGKFVGKLSYRLGKVCPSTRSNLVTVDFAGRSNAWLFLGLGLAAEFVKETEDERDFVCRRGLVGASDLRHGESLAVGMEVRVHAL
jgi:hypothetical protein